MSFSFFGWDGLQIRVQFPLLGVSPWVWQSEWIRQKRTKWWFWQSGWSFGRHNEFGVFFIGVHDNFMMISPGLPLFYSLCFVMMYAMYAGTFIIFCQASCWVFRAFDRWIRWGFFSDGGSIQVCEVTCWARDESHRRSVWIVVGFRWFVFQMKQIIPKTV